MRTHVVRSRDSDARQDPPQLLRMGMIALLIALVAILVYIPAIGGGFVWDDDAHVTDNTTLHTLAGLRSIWFEIGATPQYYPLVFTSFWIEYRLWGLDPLGYHVTNVVLHALCTVLVWAVLRHLAVPGAWLAALIFAVHPVHVESVAWITERKNVLSGVFYLTALFAYFRFSPANPRQNVAAGRWSFYVLSLFLFVCALLSKTVTCSLPAALVLIIWWKHARLHVRDVIPLAPMVIIGLLLGLVTMTTEELHVGAVGEHWALSWAGRFLIAGRAVWFYFGKLIWPGTLTFIYPKWEVDGSAWWMYSYSLAVIVVLVLLWHLRRLIGRAPIAGALFFGGTLLPALGFFNVYPMRYTYVADHYQYLASMGPIALFAAGMVRVMRLEELGWSDGRRRVAGVTMAVAFRACVPLACLITLGTLTWNQGKVYASAETLWRDTLAKNPSAAMAHNNLGEELARQQRYQEAITHFRMGLRLLDHPDTRINLGSLLAARGEFDEAIVHFEESLRLDPDRADTHTNLGRALDRQGRFDESITHFEEALRIDPDFITARLNLGHTLFRHDHYREATEAYREAVRRSPDNINARLSLAMGLAAQKETREAIRQYREVLRINPNHAVARARLNALLSQGTTP